MLRSQKDVDKHVQEIFRKISNEKEKNLRCYNVAKLYHKVGDFQRAKQYVELYLKERPDVAGAHKLLGQALEGLKENVRALEEYKCSLTLESRQPDLVIKVCELLVETRTQLHTAKYWIERAEEYSDNHPAVFRLKEYILKSEDGSGDQSKLTQLIEKEIESRPQDHVPRIRLIQLYVETKRVLDAYKYFIDLEARCLFRHERQWYGCVMDVLEAYKKSTKDLDREFHLHQLCVLERYVALCAQEHHWNFIPSFYSALHSLDQALFEASKYSQKDGEYVLRECVKHISGQFCFHIATALLHCDKQKHLVWKEWMPTLWALLELAYAAPENMDLPSHCFNGSETEKYKKLLKLWKEDRAFRCSQAGHILLSLPDGQRLLSQLNSGSWREKCYRMVFALQNKSKLNTEKTSFFMNNCSFANVPEATPSLPNLVLHDNLAQSHRPNSLHTLIWMGLRYVERSAKHSSPLGFTYTLPHRLLPSFPCHLYEELKLSANSLESNGVETLSRLDVYTFLYASVFCAASALDGLHCNSIVTEGKPVVFPVDLTEPLCNDAQTKWWSAVHRLLTNKSRGDIGEVRMIVSRGLEVVRLLGNHGMSVRLIVLLAKIFTEKVSSASNSKEDYSKRALLFWKSAITLLERLEKDAGPRVPENPLFSYKSKDLSQAEIEMLLEEGRSFIAYHLMEEGVHDKAIKIFQNLKNPYASFHEGRIYKKLADEIGQRISDPALIAQENMSDFELSEMKSKYAILLQKSRAALNLTLDRLRSPQFAGNHPLNLELAQHIEEVENCLEGNEILSASSQIDYGLLDDSFTYKFEDSLQNASRIVNTSMQQTLSSTLGLSNGQTSTPFKNKRNVDAILSLNTPSRRLESRPSPERLDAQMRRMTLTSDSVMQMLVEQNRQMHDTNKTLLDTLDKTRSAVEELHKQMDELRREVGKLKISDGRPQSGKTGDYINVLPSEEEYNYEIGNSQHRSLQGFSAPAPYAAYPPPTYGHENRTPASSVPFQNVLHQAFCPPAQSPVVSNLDSGRVFLPPAAAYYPSAAMGLNFNDRQGSTGVPLPGTIPGSIMGYIPNTMHNIAMPTQVEGNAAADPYRKMSLLGMPLMAQPALSTPVIDLSASSLSRPQPSHMTTSEIASSLSAQHTSIPSQMVNLSTSTTQAKIPTTISVSGEVAPHNFQISMPPQATIPTTESLGKSLSPLKPVTTEGILPNVPLPAYSAVSAKQPEVKPSRVSTGSTSGNDTFTEDADYNPCADFKPIIPLPEEITVTTGEEEESVLFVRRAKLFRFVGSEWKERGIGDIKILKHNVTGKPRILMRREQVFKICANHFIFPEMELVTQSGTDRAWTWGARDFSDGETHDEKFCVRFKTKEDAQQFKVVFDEARKMAKDASTPAKNSSIPAKDASGKVECGGFLFNSPPVLKPVDRQVKATPGKDSATSTPKPSPFANFSFTPSTLNVTSVSSKVEVTTSIPSMSITPSSGASLLGGIPSVTTASSITAKESPLFSSKSNLLDFAALAAQNKPITFEKKDATFEGFKGAGSKVFESRVSSTTDVKSPTKDDQESGGTEEFEPTAVFNPVIPLPSLVEVRTGEEDEDVIFEERAKLLRFDSKETQWKERGIGKMKVLKNPVTGKVRLLMRREQVLKVCCNHLITPEIRFKPLSTSDKAVTWSANDYADGEVKCEVFALKFKSPELMHNFIDLMERVQKETSKAEDATVAGKVSDDRNTKPLSELFKPKEGSWTCEACYTINDCDKVLCGPCQTPKPGHVSSTAKPGTDTVASSSKDQQPSLAELFKPKEGSWTCQACYTRGEPDKVVCQACEAPKPGHEKEINTLKSNFSFGVNNSTPTFKFGNVSTTVVSQTPENKPFSFGSSKQASESKPTFSFGIPSSTTVEASKSFSFGSGGTSESNPSSTTSASFVFAASTVTPSKPSFGSPHKFEFQMGSAAKSPAKSPGAPSGGEDSEEEGVEEDNVDVGDFKPVVPLPDKVPVFTGEEDETVLYCHRAKLYRFVDKEWKERGLGDIKVLRNNTTHKSRLLMRRDQVLKLCLNHFIDHDLELRPKDEKTWMWAAKDFSEGVIATESFACRFKTAEIAAEFKAAVESAKSEQMSATTSGGTGSSATHHDGSAVQETSPVMKSFSFKVKETEPAGVVRSLFGSNEASTSDELKVVYEAKVTPEEKSAALKLQLPENFYRYKQAPPCAGCLGCEKDSDSDQGENQSPRDSKLETVKTPSTSAPFDASAAVFGSGTSFFSNSSFSIPSSTHIFGGTSNLATGFPSSFGTGTLSSGLGSTAVNSHSTAFPILGSKFATPPSKEISSKEDLSNRSESISFLPVSNSPSFASLAAAASPVFKPTESNKSFTFAGAGSKVFGGVSLETSRNNDNDESGGENDTSEAAGDAEPHDPHFEPIIAMPDIVEVRTGEEEEEKLFCQRAKLYRYDAELKEWKERGIGEIKVLKHPLNGTFRLLLRREQVHKVVLNQLLDTEMKLKPLRTSDTAWCWGGINHAEDPEGAVEELAVKFKNSDLAKEFLSTVEACQLAIASGGGGVHPHVEVQDEEEVEDEEGDDDYEDEENGTFVEGEIVFEKSVTFTAGTEDSDHFKSCSRGDLRIITSSNGYYVEVEDESGQLLCKAPIQGDSEVKREKNVCIWKSIDVADQDFLDIEKNLTATFESESDADEFQDIVTNLNVEILERTYDYVVDSTQQ